MNNLLKMYANLYICASCEKKGNHDLMTLQLLLLVSGLSGSQSDFSQKKNFFHHFFKGLLVLML